MDRKSLFLVALFFSLSLSSLFAQDWAVALKVSTLGGNIDVYHSIGESFNAHVGYNYFALSQPLDDSEYYRSDGTLNLSSISILGDYFPFLSSTFRVTGGVTINLNTFTASLAPVNEITAGGETYNSDNIGTMDATISFNKVAPYLGFGFGNPTMGDSGLKFLFDIGTMYHGGPMVSLKTEGLLKPSATRDQEETMENNISTFKWYPVISLGLSYNF